MKKFLFYTILPYLLLACKNESVLNANIQDYVGDRIEKRIYGMSGDTASNEFTVRLINLGYYAVNKSRDSIFIPIGYPYRNHLIANIASRDSLETSFLLEHCKDFNKRKRWASPEQHYFAYGDTITFSFLLSIHSQNSHDSEWLQNISTKDLLTKINISMVKPTKGKDASKVPDIIFNNDTNDIVVNPVMTIKGKKIRYGVVFPD